MRNSLHKIALLNIIVFIFWTNNFSTTYYVSTTGNNSNPGTLASPFASINFGIGKLVAGDILYVRGGTYSEVVTFNKSGTTTNPITISAYTGETPIIDGGGVLPSSGGCLVLVNASNLKISGFEIRNSTNMGVLVYSGINNNLSLLKVHDCKAQGIWLGSDYNTLEDCEVFKCAMSNSVNPGSQGWHTGIAVARDANNGITENCIVRRCTVYNNYGEGLDIFEASHCTVEDCIVYDNWTMDLYLSDATYCLLQRNIVYNSPNSTFPLRTNTRWGITLSNEKSNGSSIPHSAYNTIINNCLYNAEFYVFTLISGTGLNNVIIANNTMIDRNFRIETNISNNINNQIRNNIIAGSSTISGVLSGITFSNNCWSTSPTSAAAGNGDVIGNPLIAQVGSTNAGELTSAFFKLTTGSPAVDKAMVLQDVTTDFFNVVRGNTPDIGAHEFSSVQNQLIITGVTAKNKTYDGNTSATLSGGTLVGVTNSDIISFTVGTGKFTDKYAGTGKTVIATGYTLTGANAGNYSLVQPSVSKADIIPVNITFTATANNKVYDGSDLATLLVGPLSSAIAGDAVSLTVGTGKFVDKNAGTAKQVSASGFALSGTDARNYSLILPSINKADITPKPITFIATPNNKPYDGNDIATINFGPISGAIASDNVSITKAIGKFSDNKVGTGKSVVINSFTLSGTNTPNYSFLASQVAKADITPKNITFTVTANNKVYDGNDLATLNIGPLTGVIASENVTLINGKGNFADNSVGTSKIVTLTGFSISGSDIANYLLVIPANPKANITLVADNNTNNNNSNTGNNNTNNNNTGNNTDTTINNSNINNILIPNVITPNGDGKNDFWQINNIDQFPDNEIVIFDRQGLTVFKANGYNNDWKGDFLKSSKPLPEGNYYYILNLGAENGILKGTISIVRTYSKLE